MKDWTKINSQEKWKMLGYEMEPVAPETYRREHNKESLPDSEGRKVFAAECLNCTMVYQFRINPDDFHEWRSTHKHIQQLMPYLTAGQRELLISQNCEPCFDVMFAPYLEDG